ncbi:ABC transporter permease [Halobacillus litoralis]|uniref:DUF6449 domain-containing protein n=1 Tax=Halobacillus litoralis TaxID=45668 RepID=UPI001CD46B40|nr:DUF6449 domain-containing protein [Halobacillus litoralis]MCA0972452.1 ABC transporter permease [Halobacillus litoralis]
MPSKTSWFKKELFKQDFRNVGWIGIIYFVGLFFIIPMSLIMDLDEVRRGLEYEHGLFSVLFAFYLQTILAIVASLFMSIFLMRYMHVRSSSDFIHSLPIKREKLFTYRLLSGIVLLLTPIFLITLIMLIFHWSMDVSYYYDLADIGQWTLFMVALTLLVFMSGIFVGSVTGLSAVQGVLTIILLLLPMGLFTIITFNVSLFTTGLGPDLWDGRNFYYLSPITDTLSFNGYSGSEEPLPAEYMHQLVYLIISVVFYFLARFSYKRRALETTSQAISVYWLKPIFLLCTMLCFSLTFGWAFASEQSYAWLVAGYVIGGIIGFVLPAMLLEKTWRIFNLRQLKKIGVYGVGVGLLIVLLPLLWKPYETYIPEVEEVESVFYGTSHHDYRNYKRSDRDALMTSSESIQATQELQEALINQEQGFVPDGYPRFIHYNLKNGKEVTRQYYVEEDKIKEEMAALVETRDYKELAYPITSLQAEEVRTLEIAPEFFGYSTRAKLNDTEEIEGLLEAMRTDLFSLSYEDLNTNDGAPSHVQIDPLQPRQMLNYDLNYNLSIDQSYTNTIDWLKEIGQYDEALLQTEEIDRVEFYRWDTDFDHSNDMWEAIKGKEGLNPFTITDPEEIHETIGLESTWEDRDYLMVIFPENDEEYTEYTQSASRDDVPAFVAEHFNE